jgi:hypothetical protein
MKALNAPNLRWLAPLLIVVFLLLAVAGFILQGLTGTAFDQMGLSVQVPFYIVLGIWSAMAALIVWFHPHNPVGWLLAILMPIVAMDQILFGYAAYSDTLTTGPLPRVDVALIWLKFSAMPFGILIFTLSLLVLPNGRFLSKSWRWVAGAAIVALPLYLVMKTLEPGPINTYPSAVSPLAVSDSQWVILRPFMWLAITVITICFGAGLVCLISRLRQAGTVERQQLKWMAAPPFLFIIGIPLVVFGQYEESGNLFHAGGFFHMLAATGMMFAMAIALFKYRLYDIDIIINRTLVYSLLTLLLAAIYFSSVVLMEQLFRFLTGQESPLAVVVSTLLIAGLFNPLRRRIQGFIDRRFYRRKYDAVKTLAAFSETARDEVDLDVLMAELMNVVEVAMQPKKLSLWIRDSGRSMK